MDLTTVDPRTNKRVTSVVSLTTLMQYSHSNHCITSLRRHI